MKNRFLHLICLSHLCFSSFSCFASSLVKLFLFILNRIPNSIQNSTLNPIPSHTQSHTESYTKSQILYQIQYLSHTKLRPNPEKRVLTDIEKGIMPDTGETLISQCRFAHRDELDGDWDLGTRETRRQVCRETCD